MAGGGAEFERGLPSFEIPVSSLVPMLQGSLAPIDAAIVGAGGTDPQFSNITGYNTNIFFEGTSVYFGFQGGVSYEISEGISVAAAARYILAKNTYNGYVKDITIDAPAVYGGVQTPGNYLRTVANAIRSNDATTAAILDATAAGVDIQTADAEVDAVQKGTGFAPILGVHFSPTEKLNIGVKYEFATKIELENETNADGTGMFTDKAKSRADLPALLSVGTSYKVSPKLTTSGGFHYFFDKPAYYGKIQVDGEGNAIMESDGISFKQAKNEEYMDNNSWELAFGLEYELNEKLTVSAGYLRAQVGVKESYQSDLSFALSSNTFGGGLSYDISNQVGLNVGIAYTKYLDENKNNTYALGATNVNHTDTYMKNNLLLGIGVNFHFGGNE